MNVSHLNSTTQTLANIPIYFLAVMRAISSTTILLNVLVMCCMLLRKSHFPDKYWAQMLCMSFNDLLSGTATLFTTFIDHELVANNYVLCSGMIVFFNATQAASLCTVLTTGLARLWVLRKTRPTQRVHQVWTQKRLILFMSSIWMFSVSVITSPFLLWSNTEKTMGIACSFDKIFGDNKNYAAQVVVGVVLVPLILTNIIYLMLLWILKRPFRQVETAQPTRENRRPKSQGLFTVSGKGIPTGDNHNQMLPKPVMTERNQFPGYPSPQPGPSRDTNFSQSTERKQKKITTIGSLTVTDKGIDSSQYLGANDRRAVCPIDRPTPLLRILNIRSPLNTQEDAVCPDQQNGSNPTPSPMARSSRVSERQWKANVVMACIVLCLNVCTWPALIVSIILSQDNSWHLDRDIRFPIFTTISCNALLNPILYAFHVPEFRMSLRYILRSVQNIIVRYIENLSVLFDR